MNKKEMYNDIKAGHGKTTSNWRKMTASNFEDNYLQDDLYYSDQFTIGRRFFLEKKSRKHVVLTVSSNKHENS